MASEQSARYIQAFEERQKSAGRSAPAWLNELRRAALESFAQLGFPTVKQEAWKYTNVQPIVAQSFRLAGRDHLQASESDLLRKLFVSDDAARLVFINGIYAAEFSMLKGLPAGVTVSNLSAFTGRDGAEWLAQLGRHADYRKQGFVALNTAFLSEGAVVHVPPHCRLTQPIQLVYASGATEQALISHPRTLVVLGAGSEASIVESYLGIDGGSYLCNPVTEIIGGDGAVVDHYRIQREGGSGHHIGTVAAALGRDCSFTGHAVTLSGALVRNDVHVALAGEGAKCALNGLYLGVAKQHVDNFTEIEHVRPRAASAELYKGILDGAARAVFNGKIVVHKDAQKTDARQTNKNLLLSPDAVINTNPQLEIYADDVKCSHGSSIGQLDPDALFYLRARGLGPEEARSLLRFAFASEIVNRIRIESLRSGLDAYLAAKLITE
jgi:Fe-S cluster assembly protein SufD